ncbi:hypothetical protein ACTA71_012026 [Dictyostelium dimigraforme]
MIKQIFFIVLLFTFLFININNVESKNHSVLGNCEKNQTAKYKKYHGGKKEIKEITTNQLNKEQLDKHEMFMKIALDIAIESKVKFVSIIVSPDDRVLCSGTYSKENAILHSELVAITNCSLAYKMVTFENHTIYSTAEPDSLSASAIVWARFKQVVYGSSIKHLYCNACFSNLPIDSTYIFSRSYGIGVENIQLVAGVLQDQTDANFGSYCNSSISSIFKTNPQCKCKNPKQSKENNESDDDDENNNNRNRYHRRRHHHEEKDDDNNNGNVNSNVDSGHKKDDSIDNFFEEIKSGNEDDFDKELESSKQIEKSKNKEKKKRHSNHHHHSHTSKDGRSRTSTSTSVSGNGHASATASASSSSSSSTSFSHSSSSSSSSSSNSGHHKKDKSKKNKDGKGDKKDKKDKKEKEKKKDKKDKSTSVEEEINTLKIEKNSI